MEKDLIAKAAEQRVGEARDHTVGLVCAINTAQPLPQRRRSREIARSLPASLRAPCFSTPLRQGLSTLQKRIQNVVEIQHSRRNFRPVSAVHSPVVLPANVE